MLEWDAGDMGCGELVLALRGRMLDVPAGGLLRVVARDRGAPEDLPSWCRLTGHELVEAAHPVYVIRRRQE
jgi:tRNA 2-thiouridine synthesizing protein A